MLVCQNAKSDFYLISGLGLRFQSHRKKLYFKYLYILKKVAQSTIHEGLRKGTVKLLVCQQYHHPSQGDLKEHEPLVKKIPRRREWLPTPVFLSGNPMDCSPPGSSIRGIILARILQWVAISFSQEDEEGNGSGFLGQLLEAWTMNTTS